MDVSVSNHPKLERSYRRVFPFRLATTSYIYPDNILPNAVLLAPYLDEIELILFESKNLPDKNTISRLSSLREKDGLLFHVHLPLDIYLGSTSLRKRDEGVGAVAAAIELTKALAPSSHTLHFLCEHQDREDILSWQARIRDSAERLVTGGIEPYLISIETLDYPLSWVEGVIEEFGFSVCLDFGHLIVNGEDPLEYLRTYSDRTSVIHMHGVLNGRDHLALDAIPEDVLEDWLRALRGFKGTLSLEVFSFAHLEASLKVLEKTWTNCGIKSATTNDTNEHE